MTGFKSKRQMAQWDEPNVSFNEWWDSDFDHRANPFEEYSSAYWAWTGWQAAQRPWVGLTDEEISGLSKGHMTRNSFARNIEQALKAKNT